VQTHVTQAIGIPIVRDRVVQGIVKTAIEPKWEAEFETCNYGFRPAQSAHDAIEDIFRCLSQKPKWILDADIRGCFDNIDHQMLINKMETPEQKRMIKQWLEAGVMESGEFSPSEVGTPQGGIISPLLANIALDGMEKHLYNQLKEKYLVKDIRNGQVRVIRYADDFVVMHKDKEVIIDAQIIIAKWLKKRGLALSEEKTQIVHSTKGFDFLGFNCRHYDKKVNGYYARQNQSQQDFKLLIKPSEKSIKRQSDKVKEVLKQLKAAPQETVISKLNPIIVGWTNYYRSVVASETFNKLDYLMWEKIWSWAKRRHNLKGKIWIANKYFQTIGKRKWNYATKKEGKVEMVLAKYADTKIKRHVKVKAGKSFYDGDEIYWAKRLSKGYGDITPGKAKMLKRQDGKCMWCDRSFKNGDLIESHHIVPKSLGGKDVYKNLALMHKHCHDQYHAKMLQERKDNGRLAGESVDKLNYDVALKF
jgi:RNA-directed DNA polymerase